MRYIPGAGPFVGEKKAAEFIGFAPATLRGWRHHGAGPAYRRVGSRILYDLGELQEFMNSFGVETDDMSPSS